MNKIKLINLGKRSGKTLCYEKEYRHCLENSNKSELVDKIIYQDKILNEMGKDIKQLRDELLDYELQNKKLQEENERLNNIIKEKSLLLIEFQDMEQRLKEKDNIINELEKIFINDSKRIKEYNIQHPERPLDNYSNYYLDKLKELKEGK